MIEYRDGEFGDIKSFNDELLREFSADVQSNLAKSLHTGIDELEIEKRGIIHVPSEKEIKEFIK